MQVLSNALVGNVGPSVAGVALTGPTVTMPAGADGVAVGMVTVTTGAGGSCTVTIWNGSTNIGSGEFDLNAAFPAMTIALVAPVVANTVPTVLTIFVTFSDNGQNILAATPALGNGKASQLVAFR